MSQTTDRRDLGYFVVQDHRQDVEPGMRLCLGAVRIVDPPEDGRLPHRSYEERTLGDVHPWRVWYASSRGFPSTTQAMAAVVTTHGGKTEEQRAQESSSSPSPETVGLRPIRQGMGADSRYDEAHHAKPVAWPRPPSGFMMLGLAGTEEKRQADLFGWLDPRMVAANRGDHDDMGSIVCDVNGGTPSVSARLQSMMRVVPLRAMGKVKTKAQNGIAWNLARTGRGGAAGLGLVYALLDDKPPPETTVSTPATPQPQFKGPVTGIPVPFR